MSWLAFLENSSKIRHISNARQLQPDTSNPGKRKWFPWRESFTSARLAKSTKTVSLPGRNERNAPPIDRLLGVPIILLFRGRLAGTRTTSVHFQSSLISGKWNPPAPKDEGATWWSTDDDGTTDECGAVPTNKVKVFSVVNFNHTSRLIDVSSSCRALNQHSWRWFSAEWFSREEVCFPSDCRQFGEVLFEELCCL